MLFYIMSPYTGARDEMFMRHNTTAQWAARLSREGIPVLSPILHWHYSAHRHGLPKDAEYWKGLNRRLFTSCDAGIVFQQPGWRESKGIGMELDWHQADKKPVYFLDLEYPEKDGLSERSYSILLKNLRADFPLLREVPISEVSA